ncbi:uncharacterized protein LOC100159755 isoform X2 [Acyrthosiphon pisum]|uniref:Uncharacterized protein n=1 Tax=Acyrthosiphon pisum TaxID=7029 RepID=A0A8R1W4L7_ACYPI|nr:uncharacterized protein LOC100159755 isoform X2 [Acyrthosiphon pisum]|eukprot:XP_001948631.1 PREDICTED: uncharacterized protein LOC100159755 isoform X2 [Acyrthosiphon pisum]
MNNGDDELHRPGTSRGVLSDQKESSRLNNNVAHNHEDPDTESCLDCDTPEQHDHMIAASLVRCDQEDSDSDNDSCIYTYRGDRQEPAIENLPMDDRSTSPLMDYLEMDFEPEPAVNNVSEDEEITEPMAYNYGRMRLIKDLIATVNPNIRENHLNVRNNVTREPIINPNLIPRLSFSSSEQNLPILQFRTLLPVCKEDRSRCMRRNSDTTEVCQKMKKMRVDDLTWIKEMIWSEKEAAQLQVNQIGVSACGATAVVNTLLALRTQFNLDRIVQIIGTRLRDETAPLVTYLESRAVAGCMPQDLVRTLETVTDSQVSARFFATHQYLDISLAPWLATWIKKGAVPILTLNLQRVDASPSLVPDSWHHQMVYGISYNPLRPEFAQIYLTNPLSISSLESLVPQLISPSSLMIKRADILSRWTPQTDLMSLATHPSRQWHRFNVLGQVVNLLREEKENVKFTDHIVIPANYKSGITLAMKTSSNFCHELKSVPEL